MAGDGVYGAILIVLADSGSQEPCPYEGTHAAYQMDAGGTGEIMESQFGKPAAAPDPVTGNGIDQKGNEYGIYAVGGELRPFCHGSGNDGGRSSAEHSLEEQVGQRCITGIIGHLEMGDKEIRRADDTAYIGTEHETEAQEPEHDRAQSKVHEILHDNVAGILGSGEPRFHHGEPGLHEVHQDGS